MSKLQAQPIGLGYGPYESVSPTGAKLCAGLTNGTCGIEAGYYAPLGLRRFVVPQPRPLAGRWPGLRDIAPLALGRKMRKIKNGRTDFSVRPCERIRIYSSGF